jgi:hypothetical protein
MYVCMQREREGERVFTKEVNTFGKSECAKQVNTDK